MRESLEFLSALARCVGRVFNAGVAAVKAEVKKQYHDARLARDVKIWRRHSDKMTRLNDRLEVGPDGAAWMSEEERVAFRDLNPMLMKSILKRLPGDYVFEPGERQEMTESVNRGALRMTAAATGARRSRKRATATAIVRSAKV